MHKAAYSVFPNDEASHALTCSSFECICKATLTARSPRCEFVSGALSLCSKLTITCSVHAIEQPTHEIHITDVEGFKML